MAVSYLADNLCYAGVTILLQCENTGFEYAPKNTYRVIRYALKRRTHVVERYYTDKYGGY